MLSRVCLGLSKSPYPHPAPVEKPSFGTKAKKNP